MACCSQILDFFFKLTHRKIVTLESLGKYVTDWHLIPSDTVKIVYKHNRDKGNSRQNKFFLNRKSIWDAYLSILEPLTLDLAIS